MKTAPILAIALFVFPILLSGCGGPEDAIEEDSPILSVSTLEITKGLRREFDVTGEVTAKQSARIVSEFRSDVADVFVKPGDIVSEGQVLLTLTSPSVSADYQTAAASYSTALQNLEQTRINSERNVQSAEVALKTAKSTLETTLRMNEAKRTQAEETYNAAKINLGLSVASAKTTLDNAIASARVTSESALQQVDQILELRTDRDDLTFIKETHIGVRNPTHHALTKQALREAFEELARFGTNADTALSLLTKTESVLENTVTTLNNSVTSVQYPESEHSGNIQSITGQLSTVRSAVSSLTSAERSYETALQQSGNNQSQVIIDAKAAYETALAEIASAETSARRQVEQAEINLEAAKASASVSDIAARSNLTGVSGQLAQARIQNEKLEVRAPFDGQIADLPVSSGDEMNVNDPLVTVENDELLKIVAYLSPTEVRGIAAGDTALLSTGERLPIGSVAPSADPESKKYAIEIWGQSDDLQAGEFVRVSFTSQGNGADDRIFVPVSSVVIKASESYVWGVLREGETFSTYKIPVTIGAIEGKYVEILQGLDVAVTIITDGARRIEEDGTEVDVQSAS